jgi:hypothetical protein
MSKKLLLIWRKKIYVVGVVSFMNAMLTILLGLFVTVLEKEFEKEQKLSSDLGLSNKNSLQKTRNAGKLRRPSERANKNTGFWQTMSMILSGQWISKISASPTSAHR